MKKKQSKKTRKPAKKCIYGDAQQFDTEAEMYKSITGQKSAVIK